jgi:DNA-binding transcriptional regulator PaaX
LDRAILGDRWDCSRESLKRFEKRGILRPLKIGQKVKYRLSNVIHAEGAAEALA